MMKPIHACLVGALVSLGCGSDTPQSKPVAATRPQIAQEAQQQQPANEQVAGGNAIQNNLVALRDDQAQVKAGPGPAEPLPRKIVRTATIKIIVDDFGRAEQELRNLLGAQNGSYIARAEITGSSGAPRHGEWTIRVPVAQFESFLDALLKLGIPQRNSVDSKDVTEEFYDVEARVKNKKVEEDRLLKHLESRRASLTRF